MILIIIIFVICALLYKVFFVDKIHVDFKSFFKRGFKKTDNQFRALVLHGKATEGVRHIAVYVILYYKNLCTTT